MQFQTKVDPFHASLEERPRKATTKTAGKYDPGGVGSRETKTIEITGRIRAPDGETSVWYGQDQ